MPREVQVKSPGAKKPPPLGIPAWGWVAAIAIGLVVGFVVYKKSNNLTADTSSGSNPSPLGDQSGNQSGGVVASPPPDLSGLLAQLQALGLLHGGSTGTAGSTNPSQAAQDLAASRNTTPEALAQSPDPAPESTSASLFSTPTTPTSFGPIDPNATYDFQAGYNATRDPIPAGVDPAQAFSAAVLGVVPTPNMTLDQLNAQLSAAGMPTQSYPSTITSNAPAMITSNDTGTPSPATSQIQLHYLYGRDPVS